PSTRTSIGSGDETKDQSKAAKRLQVKVFVEETLKKGVQGLIAEFKAMKRVNDFTKMTEFVAQIPQGRNRYKDVGCLDAYRVVLKLGPVSYIHANYVSTPMNAKRFICTQAPLPKTCAEFWYMVVQEKSVAILMLCNFVEQNAKKCAEYFPTEEGTPLEFDEVSVVMKKQEHYPFHSNKVKGDGETSWK
ncbi:Protein-tyrosine phosphatase, partial [Cooperia oncophora]